MEMEDRLFVDESLIDGFLNTLGAHHTIKIAVFTPSVFFALAAIFSVVKQFLGQLTVSHVFQDYITAVDRRTASFEASESRDPLIRGGIAGLCDDNLLDGQLQLTWQFGNMNVRAAAKAMAEAECVDAVFEVAVSFEAGHQKVRTYGHCPGFMESVPSTVCQA